VPWYKADFGSGLQSRISGAPQFTGPAKRDRSCLALLPSRRGYKPDLCLDSDSELYRFCFKQVMPEQDGNRGAVEDS
jgi:hypothetical protein